MLLISFVFTAALELVIVYNSIQNNTWSLVWAYGFLFLITLFSVHAEDSKSGKAARKFFNAIGIKSEKYDVYSNILKSIIYLLVITNIISYYTGAAMAYLVIFITVITMYTKFNDVLRSDKDKNENKAKTGKTNSRSLLYFQVLCIIDHVSI